MDGKKERKSEGERVLSRDLFFLHLSHPMRINLGNYARVMKLTSVLWEPGIPRRHLPAGSTSPLFNLSENFFKTDEIKILRNSLFRQMPLLKMKKLLRFAKRRTYEI